MNDVTGEEMPVSGHCFFFFFNFKLFEPSRCEAGWSSPSAKQRQNPCSRPHLCTRILVCAMIGL